MYTTSNIKAQLDWAKLGYNNLKLQVYYKSKEISSLQAEQLKLEKELNEAENQINDAKQNIGYYQSKNKSTRESIEKLQSSLEELNNHASILRRTVGSPAPITDVGYTCVNGHRNCKELPNDQFKIFNQETINAHHLIVTQAKRELTKVTEEISKMESKLSQLSSMLSYDVVQLSTAENRLCTATQTLNRVKYSLESNNKWQSTKKQELKVIESQIVTLESTISQNQQQLNLVESGSVPLSDEIIGQIAQQELMAEQKGSGFDMIGEDPSSNTLSQELINNIATMELAAESAAAHLVNSFSLSNQNASQDPEQNLSSAIDNVSDKAEQMLVGTLTRAAQAIGGVRSIYSQISGNIRDLKNHAKDMNNLIDKTGKSFDEFKQFNP